MESVTETRQLFCAKRFVSVCRFFMLWKTVEIFFRNRSLGIESSDLERFMLYCVWGCLIVTKQEQLRTESGYSCLLSVISILKSLS